MKKAKKQKPQYRKVKKTQTDLRFDQPKDSILERIETSLQQGKTPRLTGMKIA